MAAPLRRRHSSSSATSAPRALAVRSTCLVSTRRPASSCSISPLRLKLTSAAANPVMRVTAGESERFSIPSARSRGKKPSWQWRQ